MVQCDGHMVINRVTTIEEVKGKHRNGDDLHNKLTIFCIYKMLHCLYFSRIILRLSTEQTECATCSRLIQCFNVIIVKLLHLGPKSKIKV